MDTKCIAYNMQGVGQFNKTECFLQPFHCKITFISPISILPSIYAQNIIKMTTPTNLFTRSFDLFLSLSENSIVMLLTSLQQSCHMLTIECKTSSVIQNTGHFIPGLGEQCLTQMSG